MFYEKKIFLNGKKKYYKKKNFDELLKQQQDSIFNFNKNKNNIISTSDFNFDSLKRNFKSIDKLENNKTLESNDKEFIENKVTCLIGSLKDEIKNINLNEYDEISINEYLDYKKRLKVIVYKEIENKLETMKILYIINKNKLYKKYDKYDSFKEFVKKEFQISKSTAFKYIDIFNSILKKEITIESVLENKIEKTYKKIILNRFLLQNKEHKLGVKKYVFTKLKIKDDKKIYSFLEKSPGFLQFLIDKLSNKVVYKYFKIYKELDTNDVNNTIEINF